MARKEDTVGAKQNHSLKEFGGINTQAARESIGDEQFAWIENVQPIGFGNMPAVPGPSGVLANWAGTAFQMKSVNLGGIDYELVFVTSGAAYAVNLSSYAVTTIATTGTFSSGGTTVAQWENTVAVIVDPTNGYFTWDGATLTKLNGQIQSITVDIIGVDYVAAPTVTITGGGGTGATASSDISVGAITAIVSAGTGYIVGDVLTLSGGTIVMPATLQVTAVSAGGTIAGLALTALGDYTVAPTNPVSVAGGYGSGATFTVNFGIGPITLTNPGSGYTSAPTVSITGGGSSGATATANLSVVPSGGTAVATYAGRVWVASNRTIVFSAPNSYTDFTPTNGGGSFVVVDETLHSNITGLLSANNFLYVFGASSVNVIADVAIVSGVTVFSNTNISANIGTNQPDSITTYYRAAWFGAPYGFFALYGSTTQKASDDLDGIFSLVDGSLPATVGAVVINKILTLCYLVRYDDPIAGARPLLCCFFNKKWYLASQGDTLTRLDSAVIAGQPNLYATDGSNLYQLFSDPTKAVDQTIVTKLWDMGKTLQNKASVRLGIEVINPSAPLQMSGTIDTEFLGNAYPFDLDSGNVVQWTNSTGNVVQWVNDAGQVVQWVASGYAFNEADVSTSGHYLGVTINGSSAGTVYGGIHLQYIERAAWGNP